MDWEDARYFLAVARSGSLSGAARALGCSHSTVRRRLNGLEEALGATLFVSSAEGLALTDAAREAVTLAESLESVALELERRLAGEGRVDAGRLVVSTVDVLADAIAPSIAQFRASYPGVELVLISDNRPLDLSRREADVAVRVGDPRDSSLFGRRVGRFEWAPFANPTLAARYENRLTECPWIGWEESAGATATEAWYRSLAPSKKPAVRVSNGAALITLVRAGIGFALLPTTLGRNHGLVQMAPEIDDFATAIWCLTHFDLRHSARVRAFMRALAETASFDGEAADVNLRP